MNSLFNMFTLTDHVFPEQIWDLSTVNPEDLILTKPNPTSGSQEANIPSPHMDDFRCNYGSDVAIVKAIDIVSENMDASVDDMDIDNVLLQNFLYEPTLSADCSNPEEFEGDWTNPDLAFALFDEMMKDLDQHVRSEKPISDNPPDSVDMLDEVLVFSSSGDFASNKQLAEQADEQIGGLPNEQPCQHGNEQPREQLDEWPNKQPDESLDEQPNQHLESQSERQPDEPSKKQPNQHLDSQSNKQPDEHQDEQPREEPNDQANEEDDWHFYVEDVKPWEQPCKNRGPGRSSASM